MEKIGSYFDDDFSDIIYKDQKIDGGKNDVEIEMLLTEDKKEKNTIIKIFQLNNYIIGSVGKTEKELKEDNTPFSSLKIFSNDYNGPNPSNEIICVKLIYSLDEKILGMQIANKKNIQKRLEVVKKIIEDKRDLTFLANYDVYNEGPTSPDIINMVAMMAKNSKLSNNVKEIDVDNIEKIVNEKKIIIDVREEDEYNSGHLIGAINIPLRELTKSFNNFNKNDEIYLYCRTGHRSYDGAMFFNIFGFKNVFNVHGGFLNISFSQFRKNKGIINKNILTNYNFK